MNALTVMIAKDTEIDLVEFKVFEPKSKDQGQELTQR